LISSQGIDIDLKINFIFSIIDEDGSDTLEKKEVEKFISQLYETSSYIIEENISLNELFEQIFPILDPEETGLIFLKKRYGNFI
jgi:hypothetical protein